MGNRWADSMAKLSAEVHALAEEQVLEAKALRKQAKKAWRWMGRSSALHYRPFAQPTREAKADWPARSAPEKRALAKERGNIISACTTEDPLVDRVASTHSNFSRAGAKGAKVALRLSAAARKRSKD